MPNIFEKKEFHTPDNYGNTMKAAVTSCDRLNKIFSGVLLPQGISAAALFGEQAGELSRDFYSMHAFLQKAREDVDQISPADLQEFRNLYNKTMEYLRQYVDTHKNHTDRMSEDEYSVYVSVEEDVNHLTDVLPSIESLQRGMELGKQYTDEMFTPADEKKMADMHKKYGLFGHQPTIEECLTMTPYNTDMETYVDRLLWLTKNSEDRHAAGMNGDDNSLFGYAERRMLDYIINMLIDKQYEFKKLADRPSPDHIKEEMIMMKKVSEVVKDPNTKQLKAPAGPNVGVRPPVPPWWGQMPFWQGRPSVWLFLCRQRRL